MKNEFLLDSFDTTIGSFADYSLLINELYKNRARVLFSSDDRITNFFNQRNLRKVLEQNKIENMEIDFSIRQNSIQTFENFLGWNQLEQIDTLFLDLETSKNRSAIDVIRRSKSIKRLGFWGTAEELKEISNDINFDRFIINSNYFESSSHGDFSKKYGIFDTTFSKIFKNVSLLDNINNGLKYKKEKSVELLNQLYLFTLLFSEQEIVDKQPEICETIVWQVDNFNLYKALFQSGNETKGNVKEVVSALTEMIDGGE